MTQQTETPTVSDLIKIEISTLNKYLSSPTDKFDVGQSLATIMSLTKAHPEQAKILRPQDIGTMVASLRQGYGTAIIKAEGNKRGKNKPQPKQLMFSMEELNKMGF